jgi:glutathione S-transferase
MKLYYAPGACSLSCRIALHEADLAADFERVDLNSKVTESGDDFTAVNPKGSVPLLVLDDSDVVTEALAILMLIAERAPVLAPGGPLARTRLIEALSFLSSELHIAFKPYFHDGDVSAKESAVRAVTRCLDLVASHINELYLFGPRFTVADAYLFVMLRWAQAFGVPIAPQMHGYFERVAERPAVRRALAEEGLA